MLTVTVRFYLTAGGLMAIIGLLLRVTWYMAKGVEAFRHHVKESDEKFGKLDSRVTFIERRRR